MTETRQWPETRHAIVMETSNATMAGDETMAGGVAVVTNVAMEERKKIERRRGGSFSRKEEEMCWRQRDYQEKKKTSR